MTPSVSLKLPFSTLLLTLCAGGTAIAVSNQFTQHAQQEFQQAQRNLDDARARLAAAREDRANLYTYTQEFQRLLARNAIGEEHRLDWLETMEGLRRQRRVESFSYAIEPQQANVPPGTEGKIELRQSGMRLQFDLQHEGQLLDFLDVLRATDSGWFRLDHCALERSTAALLRAECTGNWLSIRPGNKT